MVYVGSLTATFMRSMPAPGAQIWKFLTGGKVESSPTLGANTVAADLPRALKAIGTRGPRRGSGRWPGSLRPTQRSADIPDGVTSAQPSAAHDPLYMVEAVRNRLPRIRVSLVQGRGDVLAVDSC